MSYSIALTKRTNGGFTIVIDGNVLYVPEVTYVGNSTGVVVFHRELLGTRNYLPAEWTVQGVTGFTTVVGVCDALDALGVISGDTLDDIKTLLSLLNDKIINPLPITLSGEAVVIESAESHPTLLDIPDEIDTTDGTVIYQGYLRGSSYLIVKKTIDGELISAEWGEGDWADRVSIFST
jgi:hypothetical protein